LPVPPRLSLSGAAGPVQCKGNPVNLEQIAELLEATEIVPVTHGDARIESAWGTDLLSEVLAFALPGSFLLTALTNAQVVRTAELTELAGVCFVLGKCPAPDVVALARRSGVPMLMTELGMFEACGRLYAAGLRGSETTRHEERQPSPTPAGTGV